MTHVIKIDLITGFLGAGKTTFLKKYARYLMDSGSKIGILENDYGAVNVDMMLLQDLMGDNCGLEMVASGFDADCHKRRFKTKLITMAMFGYDRVIVEPSGIYDVDEFFDTLREEPLDNWYEIGNVIAIVDGALEDDVSRQTNYLLVSQTANAGHVILSKTQFASQRQISATIDHLNRAMEQFQCKRRFGSEVLCKDWEELTGEDFEAIARCGCQLQDHVKLLLEQEGTYTSLFYMNVHLSEAELRERSEKCLQDAACGSIFRIKGFVPVDGGKWLELNATHQAIDIQPIPQGQEIVIVIGENLNEDMIDKYWKSKSGVDNAMNWP